MATEKSRNKICYCLFSDNNCIFNSPKSAYLLRCFEVFWKDTIAARYHKPAALRSVTVLSTSASWISLFNIVVKQRTIGLKLAKA